MPSAGLVLPIHQVGFPSVPCLPGAPPPPLPPPATLCIMQLPPAWPRVPARPSPGGLSLSSGHTEALLLSAPREAAGLRLEELSRGFTGDTCLPRSYLPGLGGLASSPCAPVWPVCSPWKGTGIPLPRPPSEWGPPPKSPPRPHRPAFQPSPPDAGRPISALPCFTGTISWCICIPHPIYGGLRDGAVSP